MIDRDVGREGLASANPGADKRRRGRLAFFAVAILLLCAIGFVLSRTGAPPSAPVPPSAQKDATLSPRILTGAVFQGRLWLRYADGALVSYGLSDGTSQVHFKSGVTALVKTDTALWVLRYLSPGGPEPTAEDISRRKFLVSYWTKDAFEDLPALDQPGAEAPIALAIRGDTPIVLLDRPDPGPAKGRLDRLLWRVPRVLSNNGSGWKATELTGTLSKEFGGALHWGGSWMASPARGRDLYVGLDFGEFGGGLQRVDLATGASHWIERHDSGEYCGHPLDSQCDPVTAVIPDPDAADCIFASVGLVHLFTSTGRILRVCGDEVAVAFETPLASDLRPDWVPKEAFDHNTEAFYGLTSTRADGFWAATPRTLYHFERSQRTAHPMPELKPFAGLRMSRDLPGVIVVLSEVDHRSCAPCGPAPFLVAAD